MYYTAWAGGEVSNHPADLEMEDTPTIRKTNLLTDVEQIDQTKYFLLFSLNGITVLYCVYSIQL